MTIIGMYGIGGYDPEHPSCNKVEEVVDNGDGTGSYTRWDADGDIVETRAATPDELGVTET